MALFRPVAAAVDAPGSLAGLSRRIGVMMSQAIRESGMDRYDIAAAMSRLLNEDVSKHILDAYTAESREDHNVSAYRFFAFVQATKAGGMLDDVCRQIGYLAMPSEDQRLAEIGYLTEQRAVIDQRLKALKAPRPVR
ncbi:MAG: hypothetical protein GC150_17225 [Rhizobiales bacterium]|nr:hypothetical protein [Hyphomicrobiales bacterium]